MSDLILVIVLRIGHRKKRDKRITSHVALVARAFGAKSIIIAGEEDQNIKKTIDKIVLEWGGDFKLKMILEDEWKDIIEEWKNEKKLVIHLSMYGENLSDFEKTDIFNQLKKNLENLLIVVGGKKVPGKLFHLADWNIAIGNQPHSEVSSLAIFLDHLQPDILLKKFEKAEKEIIPSLKGNKKYLDKM